VGLRRKPTSMVKRKAISDEKAHVPVPPGEEQSQQQIARKNFQTPIHKSRNVISLEPMGSTCAPQPL